MLNFYIHKPIKFVLSDKIAGCSAASESQKKRKRRTAKECVSGKRQREGNSLVEANGEKTRNLAKQYKRKNGVTKKKRLLDNTSKDI